jgi:hydroxymethylbilane synthase
MAQSNLVKAELLKCDPSLTIEIIPVKTQGDKILDVQLAKIGGKGLFTKELEVMLLANEADIAVHSMKDMPAEQHPDLSIGAILVREAPEDAIVIGKHLPPNVNSFVALPANSVVGTSSLRRASQILALRSDLQVKNLRGNVTTRLAKLAAQEFDAIILAYAGLKRLNLAHVVSSVFTSEQMLPACAQGALGVQCRSNDAATLALIKNFTDLNTEIVVATERRVSSLLNGGCQAPIAIYANFINPQTLELQARVMALDGKTLLVAREQAAATLQAGLQLADRVTQNLISQGALALIQDAKDHFNH